MDAVVFAFLSGTGVPASLVKLIYAIIVVYLPGCWVIGCTRAGSGSLEANYRCYETMLDKRFEGRFVILLGHSQGALHAARYGATHDNVILVIAINGPFAGSELAKLSHYTPKLVREVVVSMTDFVPGSTYLVALRPYVEMVKPKLVCFWSRGDLVVIPGSSARVNGAMENIELPASTNHFSEILSRSMWRGILRVSRRAIAVHNQKQRASHANVA